MNRLLIATLLGLLTPTSESLACPRDHSWVMSVYERDDDGKIEREVHVPVSSPIEIPDTNIHCLTYVRKHGDFTNGVGTTTYLIGCVLPNGYELVDTVPDVGSYNQGRRLDNPSRSDIGHAGFSIIANHKNWNFEGYCYDQQRDYSNRSKKMKQGWINHARPQTDPPRASKHAPSTSGQPEGSKRTYRGVEWQNHVGDEVDKALEYGTDLGIEAKTKDAKARCSILEGIVAGIKPKLPIVSSRKHVEIVGVRYDSGCYFLYYDLLANVVPTGKIETSKLTPIWEHACKIEFGKACVGGKNPLSEAGIGAFYRITYGDGALAAEVGPFYSSDCPTN